ncbi:hypothetical protein KAU09_01165 [Candidatus Parcubacteria bacterium]|nr:hypothetical protein [Candidatus Parcubacteria bacterium]
MTKKFSNQYCIYCLKYFDDLTKDHIFPESWYPNSTPNNKEKWVAPACFDCNNKLGKIEEETYKKLAISVTKNDIAASGVSEKASRLYNPNTAKDKKSKTRKISNIKKIIPDVYPADKIPINAFMKNCGLKENELNQKLAVNISFELLDSFAEKIIRGLEFKFRDKLINQEHRKIDIIHPPIGIDQIAPNEIKELNNILNQDGAKADCGPGFKIRYVVDIYNTSLYHIIIWGKIEIWGNVYNTSLRTK